MDRPGNLPGGQISEVMNIHSRKLYVVSTAPELGQDYWSTVVIPIIERKRFFGLIKNNILDLQKKLASFIRNSIKDASRVHAELDTSSHLWQRLNGLTIFHPRHHRKATLRTL